MIAAGLARSAEASPRARVDADQVAPGAPSTGSVCSGPGIRCYAHVRTDAAGDIAADAATPNGYGPAELQSAYQIDPAMAKPATIAIVDAYGYANLESDLAVYRTQFGLPPCTRASGCLKIVNQDGMTSPLPADPPASDDWTVETALDVDMASAACPSCKILVVQGTSNSNGNLYTAQSSAAAAHPTVISDSWGGPTQVGEDLTGQEPFFDHPGIAQFVSAGDSGYNEGGRGPAYPSTSAHVIAVGGTALARSSTTRGWSEVAWTKGGSSCSYSIAKPAYQTASPCSFRAASDIAAVGDPATGVAVYNASNGGWIVLGGTSASAPLVAAIFAATGHGDVTAALISQHIDMFFDVTSGSNGPCGNLLCNATTGWDGPTGYGTPSARLILAGGGGTGPGPGTLTVMITSPSENASVKGGFKVTATASAAAVEVGFGIDGTLLQVAKSAPYEFTAPATLSFGPHLVQVAAADAQNNVVSSQVHVIVTLGGGGAGAVPIDDGSDAKSGGCHVSSGTAPISLVAIFVAGLAVCRRRRRA
ncbi:MAG: hypothetical protein E6J91_52950 [Deltaproteobacteria bacterium]|nr:MAG: hypothetical protein E6J91_52950 [Deltaproteobacteria bacterium]